MFLLSDLFRQYLIVFLEASFVALALLFAYVLVRHLLEHLREQREARQRALHQPAVDAVLAATSPAELEAAIGRLAAAPPRHLPLVGSLLIKPLRVASGSPVTSARAAATRLGLIDRWTKDLAAHAWWRQADAARALGLVRAEGVLKPLLALLDDPHEEVRAAAVEALGHLGDPACVPALLQALPDASRHQRARVVEAIRELGPSVAHALIAHARVRPDDLATVAELIGFTGAAGATDDLLAWSGHADAKVRAAALQAIGSLGLDDRAYYYTLRALGDTDAAVRAMAARALGRSRRGDAAPYLAQHLGDDWLVAAHAATALRMLGPSGERELVARQEAPGLTGVLARQMLWERRSRPEAGGAP
jgi:HEAT repeat protein